MKVVHVLGCFDRGGVEVFLKDLYLNTNPDNQDISFLLLDSKEGVFDSELIQRGAKLNKIPLRGNFMRFSFQFYKYLKHNRINVVHSHVQAFTGFILFIAFLAGVKVRVSHSHSEETFLKTHLSVRRKIYLFIASCMLNIFSNIRLACSEGAGRSLYGNMTFKTVVNGINSDKFLPFNLEIRNKYLKEFNLLETDKIIGHVGRIDIPKNHKFLIDIAEVLIKKDPSYKFLFVGDGPLLSSVKDLVNEKKLNNNVILTGSRDDIPSLLTNLFDLFVFPSIYEGLPIVMLEAQITGLYCVISNTVSKESIVFPEQVSYLPLEIGAEGWVNEIELVLGKTDRSEKYFSLFIDTEYSINKTIKTFSKMYEYKLKLYES